mmetsp:Transcript_22345/g.88286  ORF Transcript_22345/g.88286 Transcript_22345/m.88286 type:complete len:106 (+) Transcript_22345:2128-2445(+)
MVALSRSALAVQQQTAALDRADHVQARLGRGIVDKAGLPPGASVLHLSDAVFRPMVDLHALADVEVDVWVALGRRCPGGSVTSKMPGHHGRAAHGRGTQHLTDRP